MILNVLHWNSALLNKQDQNIYKGAISSQCQCALNVSMLSSKIEGQMVFEQNIQIKIALSVDKVRILIKILAESH